MILNGDQIEL